MYRPKLSICIPTRNRANHLDATLHYIFEETNFPFPVEVCVSDNASIDNTKEIVDKYTSNGKFIDYRRNNVGVNMWTNHHNATSQARGEYIFTVSDDDRVIADQLVEVIQFLDRNPNFIAAFAPIEFYNAKTNQVEGLSYPTADMPDLTVLTIREPLLVLRFFLQYTVPPELFVVRASAAGTIFNNTTYNYSCYFDACGLLTQGDIAFMKKPFYRWIRNSAADADAKRNHSGVGESLSGWSQWRAALDEMVRVMFAAQRAPITDELAVTINDLLNFFEARRMAVTMVTALKMSDYLKAYEVFAHMQMFCRVNKVDLTFKGYKDAAEILPEIIPWAYLVHLVKMEQSCNEIYIVSPVTPDELKTLLEKLLENVKVTIIPSIAAVDLSTIYDPKKTRIVVFPTRRDRDIFLNNTNYPAAQLMDIETLAKRFPFWPPPSAKP